MFENIFKRLGIQIFIYLLIFYLIPLIGMFCNEQIQLFLTALFVVILNILICIIIGTIDTYKYKINYFLLFLPAILFIPTIRLFGFTDLYSYSYLYSISYAVGMLLGWSYKTYGYQLRSNKKRIKN